MTKLEDLKIDFAANDTSDAVVILARIEGFNAMLAEHEKLVKPLIEALEICSRKTIYIPRDRNMAAAKQALEAYRKATE